MPTTDLAAIRAQMVTTVKALTPTSLASEKFRVTDMEMSDFREHAEENDISIFREYEIQELDWEFLSQANVAQERRRAFVEMLIAYPHVWALYHTAEENNVKNRGAMFKVIEEDVHQIKKAIGYAGSSNYVSGQRAAVEQTMETEELEGVTLAVINFEVQWDADIS